MLTVQQARALILADVHVLPTEALNWDAIPFATGRVLAEDVTAYEDIPAFANSSMDGFAVRSGDTSSATRETPVTLTVIGEIPAGSAPQITIIAGTAARIMTGAMLPVGADSVIPVEATDATMTASAPTNVQLYSSVKSGAYVRPVGEDMRVGQTILKSGRVLRSADIGVLASIGATGINVIRVPKVAILATGDELVSPGSPVHPGQIRDANTPSLTALIHALGGEVIRPPIARDTESSVRNRYRCSVRIAADRPPRRHRQYRCTSNHLARI